MFFQAMDFVRQWNLSGNEFVKQRNGSATVRAGGDQGVDFEVCVFDEIVRWVVLRLSLATGICDGMLAAVRRSVKNAFVVERSSCDPDPRHFRANRIFASLAFSRRPPDFKP